MGMLFAMMLVLTFASVVLEMFLVKKIKPLRWLSHKSAVIGIIMSMGLSWALGLIFGIAGLTAGIAGVLSTIISEPIHAVSRARMRGRTKLDAWINEFVQTFRPVLRLLKICFWLALAPITVPIMCRRYVLAYRDIAASAGHGKAMLALTGPDFWSDNFIK